MGKKKNRTTTDSSIAQHTSTSTPDTGDIVHAREQIGNVDLRTPIRNVYGKAENDINNEMFEDTLPPGVAERIRLGKLFNMRTSEAGALSNAAAQEAAMKSGQSLQLAGLTASHQSDTTGTGHGVNYNEDWGGIGQTFGKSLAGSLGTGVGM